MTEPTKVRRFGGPLGFIAPMSVADSMALEEGDELLIISTAEGISVTPFDAVFAAAAGRPGVHAHPPKRFLGRSPLEL